MTKLRLLVPALLLAAACGVADPLATDVEPQLMGCGPSPQDGFHGSCWWAEEDIILRDGAGEAIMGPNFGVGGPRVPSDRFSVLGRYQKEFGGKALWMAISAYNGERLPAGVLDTMETTVTCKPPECRILTATHEDSVPIEIELYVNDAAPTPTPTAVPTPTPSPQPTADEGASSGPPKGSGAEVGTAYPFSLMVHCGVRNAYFNGRWWMANPILGINPPADWGTGDSNGTMELVSENGAVFTGRGGRVVELIPWPSEIEMSPCF
ncbi:MAG: hypothetical protein IIC95_09350 [Chloroflexi bacterium]|nr:hypothetical protein [Chloroflexota bacterium]